MSASDATCKLDFRLEQMRQRVNRGQVGGVGDGHGQRVLVLDKPG